MSTALAAPAPDASTASLLVALTGAGQLVAEAGADLADGVLDEHERRRLLLAALRLKQELAQGLIPRLIKSLAG